MLSIPIFVLVLLKKTMFPSLAACYEGCPGILMTALDDNERALSSVHLSSQALPPWKHLTDMQDHISEYRVRVSLGIFRILQGGASLITH